jgi:hypothetical protein
MRRNIPLGKLKSGALAEYKVTIPRLAVRAHSGELKEPAQCVDNHENNFIEWFLCLDIFGVELC